MVQTYVTFLLVFSSKLAISTCFDQFEGCPTGCSKGNASHQWDDPGLYKQNNRRCYRGEYVYCTSAIVEDDIFQKLFKGKYYMGKDVTVLDYITFMEGFIPNLCHNNRAIQNVDPKEPAKTYNYTVCPALGGDQGFCCGPAKAEYCCGASGYEEKKSSLMIPGIDSPILMYAIISIGAVAVIVILTLLCIGIHKCTSGSKNRHRRRADLGSEFQPTASQPPISPQI